MLCPSLLGTSSNRRNLFLFIIAIVGVFAIVILFYFATPSRFGRGAILDSIIDPSEITSTEWLCQNYPTSVTTPWNLKGDGEASFYPVPVAVGERGLPAMMADPSHFGILVPYFSRASVVLEFGAGGSTYFSNLLPNIRKIYSIEGAQPWVDSLIGRYPSIQWSVCNERITFFVPSYGPISDFSTPASESSRDLWPNYPNTILKIPETERSKIDLIYIDGRFRVACALVSLLYTDAQVFLVDDYNNRPEHYGVLEEEGLFDRVEERGEMVVLQRSKNLDLEKVRSLFEKYKFVTA